MAIKYWRMKLKGERSTEEIYSAIGASGGNVARIHFEGGDTYVYFGAKKSAAREAAKAMKKSATPEEVSSGEVTKIR